VIVPNVAEDVSAALPAVLASALEISRVLHPNPVPRRFLAHRELLDRLGPDVDQGDVVAVEGLVVAGTRTVASYRSGIPVE
jgi:hypothetical protein